MKYDYSLKYNYKIISITYPNFFEDENTSFTPKSSNSNIYNSHIKKYCCLNISNQILLETVLAYISYITLSYNKYHYIVL